MQLSKIVLPTLVIIGAGMAIASTQALAYRGDPKVQGPNYSPERHEAMLQVFANKDFAAWQKLMAGKGRVTEVIDSQEKFNRFTEAHNSGDMTAIRAELGLGINPGTGQRQGQGRNR